MMTPILRARPYYLPRPDRLYRRTVFRRGPAALGGELLGDILAEWGLRLTGAAGATDGPGRSDSAIVETDAGRKILKRYKASVEPDAARHEHAILAELARIGFPAPRLTATPAGETLIQRDGGCFALFDFLDGYFQYHNYLLLPGQQRAFIAMSGRALGALHAALRDFEPAGRHPSGFRSRSEGRWRELAWFMSRLDEARRLAPELRGERGEALRRELAAQAGWVEERLHLLDGQLAAAAPPRLIIHGDYGPYNLLFRHGAPVVILDFELARLDWRLTDLATALPSFAQSRLGFSFERMHCFLAAYGSACPVGPAELSLLPDLWQFLALRRVIVGWQRCAEGGARPLDEAREKLRLARWLDAQRPALGRWLARAAA